MQVYTLDGFVSCQSEHKADVEASLADFHAAAFSTVMEACKNDLAKLEVRLAEFHTKHDEAGESAAGRDGHSRSGMQHINFVQQAEMQKERDQSHADFAYTIAAARRSEQRRLLNFIRMVDYMVCDTLHSVLLHSLHELHEATIPKLPSVKIEELADGKGSPSANGSSDASKAEGDEGATEAVVEASSALLQVELLLGANMMDLLFEPHPDDFMVSCMGNKHVQMWCQVLIV